MEYPIEAAQAASMGYRVSCTLCDIVKPRQPTNNLPRSAGNQCICRSDDGINGDRRRHAAASGPRLRRSSLQQASEFETCSAAW